MPQPSPDLIIMTTKDTSGKLYVREQAGHYQRVRRSLSWLLMAAFVCIPWLQYQGRQAFRIDTDRFAIEVLGRLILPQDFAILALLFALAAFVLFYVTKFYGRVWCGYTCPQTIWTLMFIWIERRIEGPPAKSRALDTTSWQSGHKLLLRAAKHGSWALVALLSALTFVSYFVPARSLYPDFFAGQLSGAVWFWLSLFSLCTYLNAGLVREKVCQHMCPYARFQSSMFDKFTRQVSYNAARGEARGARKKHEVVKGLGDCVDCKLCVQVCPVGIDIRNGLQYECINCGLCIDACDDTMRQFNYPTQLIAYAGDSDTTAASGLPYHLAYGSAIAAVLVAMALWLTQLSSTDMSISRDRQQLYRFSAQGDIENTFVLRLSNKTSSVRSYQLQTAGLPEQAVLLLSSALQLQPMEDKEFIVTITLPECESPAQQDFQLLLTDEQSAEVLKKHSRFFAEACSSSGN